MLKNKFGMLKVLALALSVLMLVSLAACGNNGVAKEDMDSAIAAALAEQSKAEASKQAALESSLAAAQAAAESERKAAESSLAAAAAEASKAAAEASKAAASAEKKASEEASKAAAEASKAAASASKALEEATRTTTTKATETTAPIVSDKTGVAEVQAEFAKLKHEYTYTNEGLYLADNYAELTLLFDKAAVELQNALTKEAAESILATLKVEAAAIENVQNRADAVQALIAALGDIESEMFTTQAEMITEAQKAYTALKVDYDTYFGYDVDEKKDGANTVKKATKLGVNVADLNKAKAKLVVLEDYISAALWDDMALLYISDPKAKYDAADDLNNKLVDINDKELDVNYKTVIDRAYYKYLVLSIINGGDMAAADLPIDWEADLDDEGNPKPAAEGATHPYTGRTQKYLFDKDAPTAWFATEDLLNVYILPTLDVEFAALKGEALKGLKTDLAAAVSTLNTKVNKISAKIDTKTVTISVLVETNDIEDTFDEAADAYEAELDALSFTGDYKGNVTLADALADLNARYMAAYITALSNVVEISKEYAIEAYTDKIYDAKVNYYENTYDGENQVALLSNYLTKESANLDAFVANVEAVPAYDYDALNDLELRTKYGTTEDSKKVPVDELTELSKDDFIKYANDVIVDAFNNNFKTRATTTQAGMLGVLVSVLVEDLETFKTAWTTEEGANYASIRGSKIQYLEDTYTNDAKVAALVATIDKAIADIQTVDVNAYTDTDVNVKWGDNGDYGDGYKKAKLYYKDAQAKAYVEEQGWTEASFTAKVEAGDGSKSYRLNLKDYFTTTANDYPLLYTYTAEEQACAAAETIYLAAYAEMHKQIIGIKNYVSDYQKKINKDNGYAKTLSAVGSNADLKAEVQAFGKVYLDNIANTAYFRGMGVDKESKLYDYFNKNDYIGTTHITINVEPTDAQMRSKTYALSNITTYMNSQVSTCNSNANSLTTLWADKLAAVEAITTAINAAKYTYTTDEGVLSANGTVTYTYEAIKNNAKTLAATNYEAALDKLLADYTAKIMAVTMDNTAYPAITTWTGEKTMWVKDTKVGYSYANAKAVVDAYKIQVIGLDNWTDEKTASKTLSDKYVTYWAEEDDTKLVYKANENVEHGVFTFTEGGKYTLKYNRAYNSTATIGGVSCVRVNSKIAEAYKLHIKTDYQALKLTYIDTYVSHVFEPAE